MNLKQPLWLWLYHVYKKAERKKFGGNSKGSHESVSGVALKKCIHIYLITTGFSVAIIYMHNNLQFLINSVKLKHGGQQRVKANEPPFVKKKHEFKSHSLSIT